MPLSVEYINSIKFRLIACSDLFHDFASFRGVSISYLPSDLNYFENKKSKFCIFHFVFMSKFLLYGGEEKSALPGFLSILPSF